MLPIVSLSIGACLFGVVCARRWNICILVPATIITWLTASVAGVVLGQDSSSFLIQLFCTHVFLHFGYVFGLLLFDWLSAGGEGTL